MKVVGFSFIKNAIKLDYPIQEAILSILPLCDEFVVAVGQSEDGTLEKIKMISPKIKIIETIWDENLREGGRVLAIETNKAFQAITNDADWAFYIQGDEALHEKYLDVVYEGMKKWNNTKDIDGLLFKYLHFYGSYNYVGEAYRWYRREIRVIRNTKNIYSYRDAQGFRKDDNKKLNVKLLDAYIYHYGWVREPKAMKNKEYDFHRLWHDDQWLKENIKSEEVCDYSEIDALSLFEGTHPKVMLDRIARKNWNFTFDTNKNKFRKKEILQRFLEKLTNYRIGEYKNYKII